MVFPLAGGSVVQLKKKPDQYEKKTSENLGLRETRRRREREPGQCHAEARRAETREDRPAMTHKDGNASFNLPVKVKISQFSVSHRAKGCKARAEENEAGQTPGKEAAHRQDKKRIVGEGMNR